MPKTISQRGVHFIVKAFIRTMMEILDNELGMHFWYAAKSSLIDVRGMFDEEEAEIVLS